MEKYTLADFKTFEQDKVGYIICPTGDYTEMKEFPKKCSFGERCSFGEGCSFGEECSFENGAVVGKELRMLQVSRIGSRGGCTYFWKHDKGIYVRCGCFSGDMEAFAAKVEETHKDNKQYLKEYRGAIAYAKSIMAG